MQRISLGNTSNSRRSGSRHSGSHHSRHSSSNSAPLPTIPPALTAADSASDQASRSGPISAAGLGPVYEVQISNSSFAWDAAAAPVLHDISLEVPQGRLVIVVGPVGSGKSSLLSAVLGEMAAVGSSSSPVTVAGSVAYTAQVRQVRCVCRRASTGCGGQCIQIGVVVYPWPGHMRQCHLAHVG